MPDYKFLNYLLIQAKYFRKNNCRLLNFRHPQGFNEYLLSKKAFDNSLEKKLTSDKELVKYYIAAHIGKSHVVPTLACFSNPDCLNLTQLPQKFVIKPTHLSGEIIVVRDKHSFDFKTYKTKAAKWAKRNLFYVGREKNYLGLTPKIIIEPFLEVAGKSPDNYNFFVFKGKVKLISVSNENPGEETKLFLDHNWNVLPLQIDKHHYQLPKITPARPKILAEMISAASILAKNFEFLRVDFYILDAHYYVGELTHYPYCGYGVISPKRYNTLLLSWLS